MFLLYCFIACDKTIQPPLKEKGTVTKKIKLDVTKAPIGPVKTDAIKRVQILVYKDGELFDDVLIDNYSGEEIDMPSLSYGVSYNVYVLVNMYYDYRGLNEEGLMSARYMLGKGIMNNTYFPMLGVLKNLYIEDYLGDVKIEVERLVARINLIIDKGSLGKMKITDVKLKQVPNSLNILAPRNNRPIFMTESPSLNSADLAMVNAGRPISFFMLENCYGDLLPDNNDVWAKNPANIPWTIQSKCTYMEVEADLGKEYGAIGNLSYRFYLGEDNVKNFDIKRNTIYNIRLFITRDGMNRLSWKVDNDNVVIQPEPDIQIDLPKYLAQEGKIKYREYGDPNVFFPTDFSLDRMPGVMKNDILELEIIDDKINKPYLSVKACGCGEGILYVNPDKFNEIQVPYKVECPDFKFHERDYYVPLDGSPKVMKLDYFDKDGNILSFNEEMYSITLAKVKYELVNEKGIGVDTDSIFINNLNAYPIGDFSAVILARPNSHWFPATQRAMAYAHDAPVFINPPNKFSDLHNYSLIKDIAPLNTYPLRSTVEPKNLTFDIFNKWDNHLYDGEIEYDGVNLTHRFRMGQMVEATGPCYYQTTVYNPRSNDSRVLKDSKIYVDAYIHLAIGGKIVWNSNEANVFIDSSHDRKLYSGLMNLPYGLVSILFQGSNRLLNSSQPAYQINNYLYRNGYSTWTESIINRYKSENSPEFEINNLEQYYKGIIQTAYLPYTLKYSEYEYYVFHTYESIYGYRNGWYE